MAVLRTLVPSKAFEKAHKKFASKNQHLKTAIAKALLRLEKDAFDPTLKTHKLSGNLAAYFACSCGYDCRIVFSIEKDVDDPLAEVIVLLDIGTHDDVYQPPCSAASFKKNAPPRNSGQGTFFQTHESLDFLPPQAGLQEQDFGSL